MSKQPQPSRPKDRRPPKDKPPFPPKDPRIEARIEALTDRYAAEAPQLDPGSDQYRRLRAVLAPAHERLAA